MGFSSVSWRAAFSFLQSPSQGATRLQLPQLLTRIRNDLTFKLCTTSFGLKSKGGFGREHEPKGAMSRCKATMIAALRAGSKGPVFVSWAAASPLGALLSGRPGAGSPGNQEKKPAAVGGASPALVRREAACLFLPWLSTALASEACVFSLASCAR